MAEEKHIPLSNVENLRTVRKLEERESGEIPHLELRGPSKYIHTVARRLAFVCQKVSTMQSASHARRCLMEEMEALCWLLAKFAKLENYDVRSILEKEGGIYLDRYDRIAASVNQQRKD